MVLNLRDQAVLGGLIRNDRPRNRTKIVPPLSRGSREHHVIPPEPAEGVPGLQRLIDVAGQFGLRPLLKSGIVQARSERSQRIRVRGVSVVGQLDLRAALTGLAEQNRHALFLRPLAAKLMGRLG